MANLSLSKLMPASSNTLPEKTYTYIGIDFGTSTTVVSMIEKKDDKISTISLPVSQMFQNGTYVQDTKVPTCLAYSKKFNELYIGAGAYEARFDPRLEQGKNVWFEFKTLLGEDIGPRYSNTILDGKEGRKKLEDAVDATAIFLEYIRMQVEHEIIARNLPIHIRWAVSVPASFEANQRKDLLKALEIAGIKNIGESLLIDEPNSAFLSYVEQSNRLEGYHPLVIPDGNPISVLVFDFGAGTCDISILQFQQDDFSGVTSKNVAISHYTEIGGKDIDKLIADFLVEQLEPVEPTTPPVKELPSHIKERLCGQLLRIAEQMKIELCKQVMFHQGSVAKTSLFSTIGLLPQVKDHKNRIYQLSKISLSYNKMTEIMEHFINSEETKSIFKPINSAIRSAGLENNAIDYILFVGGSAKNPWIQDAVKKYFIEAEYLFPEDMQTLVSHGAAIHSYYYNGLQHKLIKPITGPTINLRLANGAMQVLVPSGTEIPFAGKEINDLRPQREGQDAIELPVCLTSETHILQNLRIEPNNPTGFSLSDTISLSVKISADKTLHVAAKVSSGEAVVTQLNPYSSKALSTRERLAAEGKKRFNQTVRKNGGTVTASAFINLGKAFEMAEQRRDAAEMMEEAYNLEPNSVSLNNLAVAWSNAGDTEKAIRFYRIAVEQNDVYAMVNLSLNLQWSNSIEYRELLEKAFSTNPRDPWVLYNYGKMLRSDKNDNWKDSWSHCLKIFLDKLERKSLILDDVDRAIEIAGALGQINDVLIFKNYRLILPENEQIFSEANTVVKSSQKLKVSSNNLLN